MNYNEVIRNLRNENKLSQQELADLLKIDRKTYNRLENGRHEPKLEATITLAKFYNVSLDYLAGLIDEPRKLHDEK